jgi:hypothetical protein
MRGFETVAVVKGPLEQVATYLSDLANDPRWRREWVDAEPISGGPVGLGSTTALFGQIFGRRTRAIYEISRFEPLALTEWRTVSGPLPLTFSRAFEAVDGGTAVTFRYEAKANALLAVASPLIVRLGRRQLDGDLPALRAALEN